MPSPSTHVGADEIQLERVVSAMRRMLMTVSASALVLIAIVVYLYARTFPQIRTLKSALDAQTQQNELQKEKNTEDQDHLAESCVQLATLQNAKLHDFEGANHTLDQCMLYFPDEPTLPAYKAQVMTQWFQADPSQPVRLEYARQAAETSLTKSRALGKSGSEEAYEWEILASCLQARFAQDEARNLARDRAIKTFKEAVRAHRQLTDWVNSHDVQQACTQDVTSALHP